MPGIMHRQDDNELAEGEFLVLFVCRHVLPDGQRMIVSSKYYRRCPSSYYILHELCPPLEQKVSYNLRDAKRVSKSS